MGRIFSVAMVGIALLAFIACSVSKPTVIILKNGTTIESKYEPEYNSKTGFYEYVTTDGKKAQIDKNEISEIKQK